ncbi:MAG: hypothetical protein NZ553_11450 [Caldilinea sp.]|nr:hypothetical protein [Caldilinea sp.]MDW8441081.1 hypothetical protein [Caldilineaceae bacterium]
MNELIALFIGAVLGGLLTWFWLIILRHWKSSRDLRSSAEKADKEAVEKRKKARDDRRKSLDLTFRAAIETILLALALFVVLALILNLLG